LYVSEIGDEVVAALSLCIISRAIMEKTNIFFEMVFKAYCLGGWPCGWKGSKDNGKMFVFYPE